ncbi:MAG: hypothetical protein US40_C0002G0075 [Candidatus Roizmanbacteria bacterium GW2011_GWC2_37_13]|uniref:Uncharacterized protein n=1 Tax=Candidatus Roizmanbacteria bacterium GW2011_GWC2_37_13 TaxID=1618486 RepID=A0A0G0JEE3_9BACT|nr:MAG: hypothetical protein US38_C0006G0076 [Candidatus Roizmanbacteria bacterium GW2011_GWC1_37_12]KKQ26541.1 MAG: hypothetical protein US40_C0002G0075 [Candidatus Roizmanbacteria bacterium GW2011_GWC2_37_13]
MSETKVFKEGWRADIFDFALTGVAAVSLLASPAVALTISSAELLMLAVRAHAARKNRETNSMLEIIKASYELGQSSTNASNATPRRRKK